VDVVAGQAEYWPNGTDGRAVIEVVTAQYEASNQGKDALPARW